LGATPESVDRACYAGEKTGFVKEGGAVVFAGGNLDFFGFEFSEVGG
jgi:hypothetical protein